MAPDRDVTATGPSLHEVVTAVRGHDPDVDPLDEHFTAATALVLADAGDRSPDVLFIERVERPGDRWSGQMALPGGKRDPGDPDLEATARRETHEEVGVELPPAIGRLDDLRGRAGMRGRVATFVHVLDDRPRTVPEPGEVAAIVWIPLAHLFDASNSVRHFHGIMGPFAGIRHGPHTVWGLTLGTLGNLASLVGHDLPRPRGPLLG